MSKERLIALPENIGLSEKIVYVNERGEKGVGLLAFASLGKSVHIISREKGNSLFHYLRYENNEKELVPYYGGSLTNSNTERDFYGGFQQGTQVIIDCNPIILNKSLKEDLVERFIQETYWPLLKRRDASLKIQGSKNSYLKKIIPPSLDGIVLLNEELEFEAKKSRETNLLKLFVHLVFNPESEDGRVRVFSKDVRVYDSILQMEDNLSKCEFWKCRQITGYINEPNLKLTLGRDGIQKNSRAYEGLIEKLEQIHEKYWPQIKARIQQQKEEKASKIVADVWKDILKAYEDTEPLNKRTRTPNPIPKPCPIPKPKKPVNKRKRVLHFEQPRIYEFGMTESQLRAKLDDRMGEPVVAINKGHIDYKIFVTEEKDPKKQREYILSISAHPIAIWEAQEEINRGGTLGDPFNMAVEIERRAQDLRMSVMKRKRRKSLEDN